MLNKHLSVPEITRWVAQYRPFLLSIMRADPSLEYDDLIHDLHVMLLEERELSIKAIASKYHMRKIGFSWVPEQPNSYWSDWKRGGDEAIEIDGNGASASEWSAPTGVLADSLQIAEKMHVTRRRAQQIRKKQFSALADQIKGMPDEYGQFGLFGNAAMSVDDNDYSKCNAII